MAGPGIIEFLDYLDSEPTSVSIANITSAPVAGWTVEFSRRQGFWDFELSATDAKVVSAHGFVTDESALALACVHASGLSRVVALEPPALPDGIVDGPGYAAWIAEVLAGAVDAPADDRPAVPPPPVALLPAGDAWDARFVVQPTEGHVYPRADGSRSYLAEGAAALAGREPGRPVEFWFDTPSMDDPSGLDPDEAWGPWLFEAWPGGDAEARVLLSFYGGSMGPDEVYGWTAWTDKVVWFAAYDGSTGRRSIAKSVKPIEMRERGPGDPAWWLALARLLLVIQPLAVEDALYVGE